MRPEAVTKRRVIRSLATDGAAKMRRLSAQASADAHSSVPRGKGEESPCTRELVNGVYEAAAECPIHAPAGTGHVTSAHRGDGGMIIPVRGACSQLYRLVYCALVYLYGEPEEAVPVQASALRPFFPYNAVIIQIFPALVKLFRSVFQNSETKVPGAARTA